LFPELLTKRGHLSTSNYTSGKENGFAPQYLPVTISRETVQLFTQTTLIGKNFHVEKMDSQ